MRVSFFKLPIKKRYLLTTAALCLGGAALSLWPSTPSYACNPCSACPAPDTAQAKQIVGDEMEAKNDEAVEYVKQLFEDYLGHEGSSDGSHIDFFTNDLYNDRVLPALQAFTKQMSSMAMQQVVMIGTFFDAKQQLETQRLYQELQVEAHKDYQPSHDFCTFGTNVRSLAASEEISHFNALAINNLQMQRHLGTLDAGAATTDDDYKERWDLFASTYCNKYDNGWKDDDTGLAFCTASTSDPDQVERHNIDIDYTRLVENNRTLDVALYDGITQDDEVDVKSLGNNLFGHQVLSRDLSAEDLTEQSVQENYLKLRSIAAKRNVAENSFNAIVGLKSNGSWNSDSDGVNTREFLGAILSELGIEDDEIYTIIGENPSYYAQLEILAKKLYQSPDFFAGLYDKPANVKRKSVALKAIDLMLDRAIYESQLRQEMVTSVLLSSRISPALDLTLEQSGER